MNKTPILAHAGIALISILTAGCGSKGSSETQNTQGDIGIVTLTLNPGSSETETGESEGDSASTNDSMQGTDSAGETAFDSSSSSDSTTTTGFPSSSDSSSQNTSGFEDLEPCAVEEPEPVTYEKITPINMLFVIDSSGSMKGDWSNIQSAVANVTKPNEGFIQFGLKFAPGVWDENLGGNGCFYEKLEVAIAKNNSDEIDSALANHQAWGGSPFYEPLQFAYDQLVANPSKLPKYVAIISDGFVNSCSGQFGKQDVINLVGDAFTQKKISTYIVSLGDSWDETLLNTLAEAGGVPNEEGENKFYDGDLNLDETLKTIVEGKLGCTLDVTKVPPEPANMMVEINETMYRSVIKGDACPDEGGYYWLEEPSPNNNFIGKISLCGSACTALEIFNTAQFKFYCVVPQ